MIYINTLPAPFSVKKGRCGKTELPPDSSGNPAPRNTGIKKVHRTRTVRCTHLKTYVTYENDCKSLP